MQIYIKDMKYLLQLDAEVTLLLLSNLLSDSLLDGLWGGMKTQTFLLRGSGAKTQARELLAEGGLALAEEAA